MVGIWSLWQGSFEGGLLYRSLGLLFGIYICLLWLYESPCRILSILVNLALLSIILTVAHMGQRKGVRAMLGQVSGRVGAGIKC